MKMNISEQSWGGEALEVKAAFVGFSDPEFAKKIGFGTKAPIFLQMSANRDLFNLENGNDALKGEFKEISNRFFEASFRIDEHTDHFEFEYTVSEPKLKIGDDLEPYWDDSQVLWRECARVKVLESDYDDQDTRRVIHELCATIAIMICHILAQG